MKCSLNLLKQRKVTVSLMCLDFYRPSINTLEIKFIQTFALWHGQESPEFALEYVFLSRNVSIKFYTNIYILELAGEYAVRDGTEECIIEPVHNMLLQLEVLARLHAVFPFIYESGIFPQVCH